MTFEDNEDCLGTLSPQRPPLPVHWDDSQGFSRYRPSPVQLSLSQIRQGDDSQLLSRYMYVSCTNPVRLSFYYMKQDRKGSLNIIQIPLPPPWWSYAVSHLHFILQKLRVVFFQTLPLLVVHVIVFNLPFLLPFLYKIMNNFNQCI